MHKIAKLKHEKRDNKYECGEENIFTASWLAVEPARLAFAHQATRTDSLKHYKFSLQEAQPWLNSHVFWLLFYQYHVHNLRFFLPPALFHFP